jgi:hypothetical protein
MNKLAKQAKILMNKTNEKLKQEIRMSYGYKELQVRILEEANKGSTCLLTYLYDIKEINSNIKHEIMARLLQEEGFKISYFTGVGYKRGINIEWGTDAND